MSADGADDTRAYHAAIAARDACAVMPARKHARPWLQTTPGAHAGTEILRATRRRGRMIRRRWSGCQRRSLVETRMRCFKLPGECVMARDMKRQATGRSIRAAIPNRCTALGTLRTRRVGSVCSREGKAQPQAGSCSRAGAKRHLPVLNKMEGCSLSKIGVLTNDLAIRD